MSQLTQLRKENELLKLRLANRTAQVDLLLQQIEETKLALAYAGLEITYTPCTTQPDTCTPTACPERS